MCLCFPVWLTYIMCQCISSTGKTSLAVVPISSILFLDCVRLFTSDCGVWRGRSGCVRLFSLMGTRGPLDQASLGISLVPRSPLVLQFVFKQIWQNKTKKVGEAWKWAILKLAVEKWWWTFSLLPRLSIRWEKVRFWGENLREQGLQRQLVVVVLCWQEGSISNQTSCGAFVGTS